LRRSAEYWMRLKDEAKKRGQNYLFVSSAHRGK